MLLLQGDGGVDGSPSVEISDAELRRALQLTTEDLRFADSVIRRVAGPPETAAAEGGGGGRGGGGGGDLFLDGVGWEGGDEWVRAQFRFYLVCLLRTRWGNGTNEARFK